MKKLIGPLPLQVEAEHYRLGLYVGFYTRDEVIAWADAILVSSARPHPDVVELSLINHPDSEAIAEQIRGGYRGATDMRLPIVRLFEEMAAAVRCGAREPAKVAEQVYQVARSYVEVDLVPEALVVDEIFSPDCSWIAWIDTDPVEYLLEVLDRASCLLSHARS